MLQSEITGDGMDAVASEISLVERSRRCAIHISPQSSFLEVTIYYLMKFVRIGFSATGQAIPAALPASIQLRSHVIFFARVLRVWIPSRSWSTCSGVFP